VEEQVHPLMKLARHFWARVPWMLEATIALQLILGQLLTASMIAALLVLNVLLANFQESQGNAALALLKQRLTLRARVKRDGAWIDGPAANLVPDDIVQISLGDVVPADITLIDGSLLLDQSMLTGESIPAETEAGKTAYAGGLVRRGAAIARVTATGTRTYFGRTAELVSTAHIESAEQKAVLSIVRILTVINFVIASGIVVYALAIKISVEQIMLLVLTTLLSAVPVALPATTCWSTTLASPVPTSRPTRSPRPNGISSSPSTSKASSSGRSTPSPTCAARAVEASSTCLRSMGWSAPRMCRPTMPPRVRCD
jgi:H+-transporting ATPase